MAVRALARLVLGAVGFLRLRELITHGIHPMVAVAITIRSQIEDASAG